MREVDDQMKIREELNMFNSVNQQISKKNKEQPVLESTRKKPNKMMGICKYL
jgi:hypothetical protein